MCAFLCEQALNELHAQDFKPQDSKNICLYLFYYWIPVMIEEKK